MIETSGSVWNRRMVLIAVMTLLAATFPLWVGFDMPGSGMDEGALLVYPEQITKGKLPYRDFETFYGPANIYFLAIVYWIFGIDIGVERGVAFLYSTLLLAGIFSFARRWGVMPAVSAALISGICFAAVPLVAFAWLGGVTCLIWSLLCLSGTPSLLRAALGGFLASAALLYRPDLGPAAVLSAIPMFLSLPNRARRSYIAGVVIGILPLGALLLVVGWKPIWENLFLYPVVICSPGRRLPMSSTDSSIIFLFVLHLFSVVCLLVVGAIGWWRDRHSESVNILLSWALLAIGVTHQSFQRIDETHLIMTALVTVGVLPLVLAFILRRGRVEPPHAVLVVGAAVLVIVAVTLGAPRESRRVLSRYITAVSLDALPPLQVTGSGRRYPSRFLPLQTQRVINLLERAAKPGERLFVGSGDLRIAYYNDTFIYHLVPWMEPASYFLELNPFSANRVGSRLTSDIASADWLVLNHVFDHPNEPNLAGQPGPDAPVEVVRKQFEAVRRFGPYAVYRRKNSDPSSVGNDSVSLDAKLFSPSGATADPVSPSEHTDESGAR